MEIPFSMIVACDRNNGIGINNQLPWRLPGDMKYFRELTIGPRNEKDAATSAEARISKDATIGRHRNAVIMGRKTWHSIPDKFKPLADRLNIVLTRNRDYQLPGNVCSASSLDDALEIAASKESSDIFLIGGSHIYADGLTHASCRRLYITQVLASFDCDVFFPIYKDRFHLASQSEPCEENGIKYRWEVYDRKD